MYNTATYSTDTLALTTEAGNPFPSLQTILFPDFQDTPIVPVPDSGTPVNEAFMIDNLSKASWAVSKILEAEARIARRIELAGEFKTRIDQWLESASREDNESISYLSILLEPYVKDEVSKLHKSRTLSLPTGIASLRKLPDRLEIIDTDGALTYCETEHPEAVIIKKELDKSILKDLILKQAEPIPGVEAELGTDKLYVKPLKLKESI
jgi:phage host-nuclease inhibitor protein Gam